MNAADVLNDWLKAIYDTEDEVYKSLIADQEGLMEIQDNGILYYDFSNSDNIAEDKSGNGNHGTATDVVGVVEDGRAFGEFNGESSWIVTSDIAPMENCTFCCCFVVGGVQDSQWAGVVGHGKLSTREGFSLVFDGAYKDRINISLQNGTTATRHNFFVPNFDYGEIHSVILQKVGTEFSLWWDGIYIEAFDYPDLLYSSSCPVSIGRWGYDYDNYYFNGLIGPTRIYNRILTDAERTEIYEKDSITHYFKPNNELVLKPTDYNIGVIASILEYLRQSDKEFVLQLYLDKAVGEWLDYIAIERFGIMRLDGETPEQWVDRIIDIIIGPKLSKAAIIYNTRKFSVDEPAIVEGIDGAFCDVSFEGYYKESFFDSERGKWVIPAIIQDLSSDEFYFRLYLTGTTESDIMNVVNTVDRIKAAGIEYEIRIS